MRENIDELLQFLDYYHFLACCDFFSCDMQEKIDNLAEDIKTLRDLHEINGDFSTFDFKRLKSDLNSLFNQNVFSPPSEFLQNPEEALENTLDIVDMITYQISKDPSFTVGVDGEIIEQKKPKNLVSQKKENISTRMLDTAAITLFVVSERFNYLFKGIPATKKEYFHLLDKYDKIMRKLNSKIKFLDSSIDVLESQIQLLRTERFNILRDEYVEDIYGERLAQLHAEAMGANADKSSFEQRRMQREAELEPSINQAFFNWQSERQFYINQYNSLYNAYVYQSQSMQDQQFLESKKRLDEMLRYINENYSDANIAYTRIRESVLAQDVSYQQIIKADREAERRCYESNSRLGIMINDKEKVIEDIRHDLEEEYSKKIDDASRALEPKKKLRTKLQAKLDKTTQKKERLIGNHQREFDWENYHGRQKQ